MKAKDQRIAELKQKIPQLTPVQASDLRSQGSIILDIRDPDEVSQGSPEGALRMSRSFLELNIEEKLPDLNSPIMVMCASGMRSLFAANDLNELGYPNVSSIDGGFTRWKNEGLPWTYNIDKKLVYKADQ